MWGVLMHLRATLNLQLNTVLQDPELSTVEQLKEEYTLLIQNLKDYCFDSGCPEPDSRLELLESKGIMCWKEEDGMVFKFPFGNLVL